MLLFFFFWQPVAEEPFRFETELDDLPKEKLKGLYVQLDHFKNQAMKLWLKLIIYINFESEIHSGKINNCFLTNSNDQIHASTNRSNLLFFKRQKLLD